MTEKEFDVLSILESHRTKLSQRELAKDIGVSVGTINSTLVTLEESGLVENGIITQKGIDALEPYRVKRAVFIAAGFGSSLEPKPAAIKTALFTL